MSMRQLFAALFGSSSRAPADHRISSGSRSASDERDALARALARTTTTAVAADADSARTASAAAAAAAASAPQSTLVFFSSPRCALCRSLAPDVRRAREAHSGWLDVVEVTADDGNGNSNGGGSSNNNKNGSSNGPSAWAPEMLAFGVEAVPCFVLVTGGGAAGKAQGPRAVARSGRPRGKAHAQRSLAALVRLAAEAEGGLAPRRG